MNACVEYEHSDAPIEVALTDSAEPRTDATLPGGANWYALYTRHQHERAVAHHLEQMGFDVFLPLYREVHQWKDRRKSVLMPLFPSYVFFSGDLDRRFQILNTPGVFSLVCSGAKVGVIPAAELEAVRRAMTNPMPLEPHPFLQCGERIRVRSGPLAGIEGIVARRKDSLRIVLSVEMLRRSVSVEVEEEIVERVSCS
ncbi:MAG: UpxY family transcription antiterminator [Terracidiphilus sp.]